MANLYKNLLKVEGLNLARNDKFILKDINFKLDSNNHLAIIGPNGAGKSFLTRILALDILPSYGSKLQVLDKELGKYPLHKLRKEMGFISSRQADWFNLGMPILEIVQTGIIGTYAVSQELSKTDLNKALESLNNFLPQKDPQTKFETLSDGERRKVILARSLVNNPKILILDEPTMGMDIPSREKLLTQIDQISSQVLVIYVTHHLSELPQCIKNVMLLKNGEVFKYGEKNNILNSKNLSKLFDTPLVVDQKANRYFVHY